MYSNVGMPFPFVVSVTKNVVLKSPKLSIGSSLGSNSLIDLFSGQDHRRGFVFSFLQLLAGFPLVSYW